METNKQLYETMYNSLASLGMCEGGLAAWSEELDQDAICKTMHKYLDFILERDYPSSEFIEEHFDREILHNNRIYVNEDFSTDNIPNGSYILNGSCTGNIASIGYAAVTLHIRHTGKMVIRAKGMSCVYVRVYDDAEVEVHQEERSKVHVYRYGDRCKVNATGNVSVRDRDVY